MKNEQQVKYLKWNYNRFSNFKRSCEKNLDLFEGQVYQPYYSLYFNIHNTKNSHKLIDLENNIKYLKSYQVTSTNIILQIHLHPVNY